MKWKPISELKNEKFNGEVLVEVGFFGQDSPNFTKYALGFLIHDENKISWIAYPGRIRNYELLRYIRINDIERGELNDLL